ncbi:MAG: hypothetical protein V7L27_15665 [Nostoc sp.]
MKELGVLNVLSGLQEAFYRDRLLGSVVMGDVAAAKTFAPLC